MKPFLDGSVVPAGFTLMSLNPPYPSARIFDRWMRDEDINVQQPLTSCPSKQS